MCVPHISLFDPLLTPPKLNIFSETEIQLVHDVLSRDRSHGRSPHPYQHSQVTKILANKKTATSPQASGSTQKMT